MTLGSGGDPHSDHTARRLIVELQALVEGLQQRLIHLDQRVRDEALLVRRTLTLIIDETFQDQRRRKEQREADERARAEEKKLDTELRTTRQHELDHTLYVLKWLVIAIVIILAVATFLWIGARFL